MANGNDLKLLLILVAAGLAVILVLGWLSGPVISAVSEALAPGIGLKQAVIWGFFITVGLFVLFALVAGDGIVGELHFMLSAFFSFFAIFTLLIAWIF